MDPLLIPTCESRMVTLATSHLVSCTPDNGLIPDSHPGGLVFDETNWNDTQIMRIGPMVTTYDRPGCHDGQRFCDQMADRKEYFGHKLVSADKHYGGNSDLEHYMNYSVDISIVYDPDDVPEVTTSFFTDELNGIIVRFDRRWVG